MDKFTSPHEETPKETIPPMSIEQAQTSRVGAKIRVPSSEIDGRQYFVTIIIANIIAIIIIVVKSIIKILIYVENRFEFCL